MTAPRVSVVMATYGRGRHILPSIRSVLAQTLEAFELLVVGDACTDETETVVRAVADPRVRWLNLDKRVGSQSGPNNAGLAAARADVIAYLGHDDIWEPDHLARLEGLYQGGGTDLVVSGTILHPPEGVDLVEIMGIFPDGSDVGQFFFPPSSFSHRREVIDRIGGWHLPETIARPVDDDLLHRATEAGLCFRSTGVVTVHKFTASQRYLSYLQPTSDEQEEMLDAMGRAGHGQRMAALIDAARAGGRFMRRTRSDPAAFAPGELYRQSLARRGAKAVPLVPLAKGAVVRHRVEPENLDWKTAPKLGFRRNWVNPRPRLLVPVTGGRASLRFLASCREAGALGPIAMLCNGERVLATPGRRWFGRIARYQAEIALRPDAPTVLELLLGEAQRPAPRRRLAIGPLHLRPL